MTTREKFNKTFLSFRLRYTFAFFLKILVVTHTIELADFCVAAAGTSKTCDESALPSVASKAISGKFSSWRVVKMEDLSLADQRIWRAAKGDACPGIAVGNFEPAKGPSYALLLVPRHTNPNRSKLVVLVRDTQGSYASEVLDDWGVLTGRQVIYKVPSAQDASDADASCGIQLRFDGFKVEEIGKAATLYFWEDARYLRCNISKKEVAN